MNQSQSDFVRNLVIKDIIQTEASAMGVLAALLIANNQSSDEYDTECDYEEGQEGYDEDDDEEEEEEIEEVEEVEEAVTMSVPMPIPMARPVPVALPRKRSHSELRDETPSPIPQGPQNKRVRLAAIPVNEANANYSTPSVQVQVQQPRNAAGINILNPATNIDIPKQDFNESLRPLYTPEHVIASVPSSHPFANVLVRACADMMYRFRGKTSEKNLAIMATRMWREPREASMYDLLSDKNKQIFFEKWVGEVRLGQWTPRPVEPRYQSAPGESYVVTTTTTTTIQRLRPDVLKLVDASSKGKLDDRVRLWLSNVQPN
ncbi:hypothetical protein B0T10DRAFT_223110 [Thelonectria olida]|uniref:Uncharacterized protein n=1 Tax=Thelonectria olida TaxID=1576542 RepID=A0A9P8WCN1_9HYPO|nr:hypothetical protein B0T10DRAFT_223110 [Thelonectria olida]